MIEWVGNAAKAEVSSCVKVEVASARLAQATGEYPGNVTGARFHLQQAIQVICNCLLRLQQRDMKGACFALVPA